jgi:pimeloyl-ACP methyl ester carboxylesterase
MPDGAFVPVRGGTVYRELFGDPADPLVLLIGGGASALDYWDAELCRRIAGGGRAVVRYDHRDTGASTTCPPGQPDYDADDMCADALAVIDSVGADRAHIAGLSMGGGIAQVIALAHRERVATLTLMSTSPAGPGSDENGLPPVAPRLAAAFEDPAPEPDWSDRAAVVDHVLADLRLYAGSAGFDDAATRRLVEQVVDRSSDMAAGGNHYVLDGGFDPRPRLAEIAVPTLVIHGTDDPLFPLGHGEALAREIPGARLLVLEGVGHEVPPPSTWDVVVPALLAHTAPGEAERSPPPVGA